MSKSNKKSKKFRRNQSIEDKYLYEISQFTDLPVDKIKEVFKYYKLLLLFDVATRPKPKGNITICLPLFSTFRLRPYVKKGGEDYLGISVEQRTKNEYLKTPLEEAYFNDKNYLLEYLLDEYGEDLLSQMQKILEESED